ncbi:Saccharopine dehydrogenase-domain-containing protein [Umbelopsis sp. PMI_123]|nr:Saccharopine dehydrogenase-domain-containing protein [Umbelopsis sp. PMI_123]
MYRLRQPLPRQARSITTIALRRENKGRWERRVALTPQGVESLIKETGAKFLVQPSTNRVYNEQQYVEAGAHIAEDISSADIILGIKEVPIEHLIPNKTYMFFSHTHKGTPKNMPMLQSILDKNITLIDYEQMTAANGKRVVAFGKYAGNAGMINSLHGLGHRLLGLGYNTPFMYAASAHTYRTLQDAKSAISAIGSQIESEGTPKDFGPLTFTFTGAGNVAQGALEVFRTLPYDVVPVTDLPKIVEDRNPNLKKLYVAQAAVGDYTSRKDGSPFDQSEYLAKPELYQSDYHTKIAPYTTSTITGAYWDAHYPRLLSNEQLKQLQLMKEKGLIDKGRVIALTDIVADVNGAFECFSHTTSVGDPFYYYDAVNNIVHKDVEKPGYQILGVDILPAELPIESSQHFSNVLSPYLKELVLKKGENKAAEQTLRDAIVADKGKLTEKHNGLYKFLGASSGSGTPSGVKPQKKVLLLGSGLVAKPLVERLLKRDDVHLKIASNSQPEARALAHGFENASIANLDISDTENLDKLVSGADVVISLVPAFLHSKVAESCIRERKHMVTASYVSKEMKALEKRAQDAGITIMNEIGLDPGIDHLSAMKIIDSVQQSGGRVNSFVSWCGGLPAPEASAVPLGYKFSWSPRGVLTAGGNDATFLMNGRTYQIPGVDLLKEHFSSVPVPTKGFAFEGVANRDSLSYIETYKLGSIKDMDTMFRGTLRYQGYSDLMHAFKKLGLLEANKTVPRSDSWTSFFDSVVGIKYKDGASRQDAIFDRLQLARSNPLVPKIFEALEWLSLTNGNVSSAPAFPAANEITPLDAFSALLASKLSYQPGERDMIAMHHEFGVINRNGDPHTMTSTLITYGDSQHTAMAKTVGLPCAMAVELVLDGRIPERGVLVPTAKHVYEPILHELEQEGIQFLEQTRPRAISEQPLFPGGSGLWTSR